MRAMRTAQIALALAGIAALAYCAAVLIEARIYQARAARELARQLRPQPNSAAVKRNLPALRNGDAIGRMEIPRLRLSVMFVEGVDAGDLRRAAGHIPGTALPGQTGNIGIAGHRDTFFRSLRSVKLGDTITLETTTGEWRYRVVSLRVVKPEDVAVLDATHRDALTLVTCFPFHFIGAAPERFVVRAERLADRAVVSTRPRISTAATTKCSPFARNA
jgi:sortase A